jgi:NADH-quinone oxidoreductase subunit L
MTIPLVVLSIFAVFAGFAGFPGLEPNFGSFIPSHGHHGPHHFNFLVAGISTLVVFAGILLGWKLYSGDAAPAGRVKAQFPWCYKVLENKFYFDHFYDGVLVAVIYNGIGKILNYIEVNFFINFLINGFAYIVRVVGRAARGTITGQLQHYTLYMVSGVVVLVVIFLNYFG